MKLLRLSEERKQLLIFSSIGIFVLLLDFYFILQPQVKSLFSLIPQIREMSMEIKSAKRDAAMIDNLSSRYYEIKEVANKVSKKIILEEELPLLLEEISQIANKNNIKIMEISPLRDPRSKEVANISSKEKIYPFAVTIEAASSYHKLGKFLSDIDNMERFLKIYNFEITPSPADYLKHWVKLTLATFIIKK